MHSHTRTTVFALAAGLWLVALLATPAVAQDDDSGDRVAVVVTLPVYKAITEAVGGDRVSVESLTTARQDPHHVDARPSLAGKVRSAKLFVETGLSLEIWTESVLRMAGRSALRPGGDGHVYAASGIATLEKPEALTRAQGDVHPGGNPHVYIDPVNAKTIAANIAAGLKRVDPDHASEYDQRLKAFQQRINVALYGEWLVTNLGASVLDRLGTSGRLIPFLRQKEYRGEKLIDRLGGWHKQLLPLYGKKVVTWHRYWTYFANRFGLETAATIEPLPGLPPTAAHRDKVEALIKAGKIPLVMVSALHDASYARRIAEAGGAKLAVLPNDCGADGADGDFFTLIDAIVSRLSAAAAAGDGDAPDGNDADNEQGQ